jgi:hypothetical protein
MASTERFTLGNIAMQQEASAGEGLYPKLSYAESQDLTTRKCQDLNSNIESPQPPVYLIQKDTLKAMATAALSLLENDSPVVSNTAFEYGMVGTEDYENCKDSEAVLAESSATLPEVNSQSQNVLREKP